MKNILFIITSILTSFTFMNLQNEDVTSINESLENANPFVDYSAYGKLVQEVEQHRAERLISFNDFLRKSKKSKTIILDTRSKSMYDLKHIKGAVHLNFADFTQFSLDEMLAKYDGRNTRILIYCNNNFADIGNTILLNEITIQDMDMAFVSKSRQPEHIKSMKKRSSKLPKTKTSKAKLPQNNELTLVLNIPTYINLFGYGYKNVFELNELVDVKDARIVFEGSFDDL